jgi:hypothetical protein
MLMAISTGEIGLSSSVGKYSNLVPVGLLVKSVQVSLIVTLFHNAIDLIDNLRNLQHDFKDCNTNLLNLNA